MKRFFCAASLFLLVWSVGPLTSSAAEQSEAVDSTIVEQIRKRIMNARPDLMVESVVTTPVANLYRAQIASGPVIYTTADGQFFLNGDLFEVQAGGIVNLAELERQEDRVALMADISESDMIVFTPAIPAAKKATVTVFTDVDCGYCQKLHREVPELNRRGIEVRYLAYPRAGVGSSSFDKLVTAWCSDNQQEAMTRLKNREAVPNKKCDNPVADQLRLGQELGIRGTPAMITDDGRLLPGYMPASELARTLGLP